MHTVKNIVMIRPHTQGRHAPLTNSLLSLFY
jgi:hypothetical protein